MKLKRILSLALSLVLLGGVCAPGAARAQEEAAADARLARVTGLVKQTLGLDTEEYSQFRGNVSEQELGTVWDLYWSGEETSLNVEALEDGTVVSFWRSDNESYYRSSRLPAFPRLDAEAAKKAAGDFLARVLDDKTETVELGEPDGVNQLNATNCWFRGTIRLNGLDSPLSYNLTVRGSDYTVTNFRRDAPSTSFLGNIPSAVPAVSQKDAAEKLRGTLNLELVYVRSEEDAQRAVLRYIPKDGKTVYVDAQTGELVTPSDMAISKNASFASASAAEMEEMAADAGGARLTEAEQEGVDKLEGVWSREKLDRAVRAESAYRLEGYTLSASRYRLIEEEGQEDKVLCTLEYTDPQEDSPIPSRSFTVNARTGAVESAYANRRWNDTRESALSLDEAREIAEGFFARFQAHAAAFALYDQKDNSVTEQQRHEGQWGEPSAALRFARQENGIFFPEDSFSVTVDLVSGAVLGVSGSYTDALRFDDPEGVVSPETALDAWLATYEARLAYRLLPRELDAGDAREAKLIEQGITRFYGLFLSYALEREDWYSGVDAKTGEAVQQTQQDSAISYTDTEGHWAQEEIEKLARFGLGYAAQTFQPDAALTQWDLVCLLASIDGLRLDPAEATKDQRSAAYSTAYRTGMLQRGERDDEAPVTRALLIRCLLNSAGYGEVARLQGIFTCDYRDLARIPQAELGYAALARAFGLVGQPNYDGQTPANRAMAAAMLCRLMNRDNA